VAELLSVTEEDIFEFTIENLILASRPCSKAT